MSLLGPRARGGAVGIRPALLFGAVRGCPATGLPAQACRWRNAAGAMDLSLPQRTARSVGAGESGLLASFMLGLLVSYRR